MFLFVVVAEAGYTAKKDFMLNKFSQKDVFLTNWQILY